MNSPRSTRSHSNSRPYHVDLFPLLVELHSPRSTRPHSNWENASLDLFAGLHPPVLHCVVRYSHYTVPSANACRTIATQFPPTAMHPSPRLDQLNDLQPQPHVGSPSTLRGVAKAGTSSSSWHCRRPACQALFQEARYLVRHLGTKHRDELVAIVANEDALRHSTGLPSAYLLKLKAQLLTPPPTCDACHGSFTAMSSLERHVKDRCPVIRAAMMPPPAGYAWALVRQTASPASTSTIPYATATPIFAPPATQNPQASWAAPESSTFDQLSAVSHPFQSASAPTNDLLVSSSLFDTVSHVPYYCDSTAQNVASTGFQSSYAHTFDANWGQPASDAAYFAAPCDTPKDWLNAHCDAVFARLASSPDAWS